MDDLQNIGYRTGIYVYPDGNNRESAEEKHLAGFHNQMILKAITMHIWMHFQREWNVSRLR